MSLFKWILHEVLYLSHYCKYVTYPFRSTVLTFSIGSCVLLTDCIYGCRIVIIANRNYFPKQL
jgi:hypothetical protein